MYTTFYHCLINVVKLQHCDVMTFQLKLATHSICLVELCNIFVRFYLNSLHNYFHSSSLLSLISIVSKGGHRVPMIFRYDRHFPKNEKRSHMVGLNDVYRTLCDLVKVKVPAASAQDSVSFADYIYSNDNNMDLRTILAQWSYTGREAAAESIRLDNMKYIQHFNDESTEELYDLDVDLGEKNNLIDKKRHADLIKDMRDKLKRQGPCPKDYDGTFIINKGTPRQERTECTNFQQDMDLCVTELEGEIKCSSICGRHKRFCRNQRPGT